MKKIVFVAVVVLVLAGVCGLAYGGAANVWIMESSVDWANEGKYYCDYSWKVHIMNNSHEDVRLMVKINLMDRSGHVVHSDEDIVRVRARTRKWVHGTDSVRRGLAEKAVQTSAGISRW